VGGFQVVGCRCLVSLRVGLSVISEFCGLLVFFRHHAFFVCCRVVVWVPGAVAGVLSGMGGWVVFLGFSGLFGLGVGRSLGLAVPWGWRFGFGRPLSACRVWVCAAAFRQSGWVF
jgi:hypothetical protein